MKNKKAISPLIATVLLIGFTVALAAVVMTWGGGFIKKTTEQTGSQSEKILACANLNLEIKGVNYPTCTELTVSNSKDTEITEFGYRTYNVDDTLIKSGKATEKLEAYGIVKITSIPLTGVNKVELIPTLKGGITCADAPAEKVINCDQQSPA